MVVVLRSLKRILKKQLKYWLKNNKEFKKIDLNILKNHIN
jgi:hypothetical protein